MHASNLPRLPSSQIPLNKINPLQTLDNMPESEYPYTIARSTGSDNSNAALLASILVAGTLDEISDVDDFSAVERYIRNQGRVSSEKTTTGLLFWVYPTGLHGPFHKQQLEGGGEEIKLHGTLVVVESGVSLVDAMRTVREEFRIQGIGHLHIGQERLTSTQ